MHKETWDRLAGALGRLPHALLVHGARGVGKIALAERFAQLLLCERRGQGTMPCAACEACRWFSANNHPDLRYVEPEVLARHALGADEAEEDAPKEKRKPSLQIRIEQTRALADFVNLASHRGGRRIAIIHPAEDMNTATANSLLKILEEPPAAALFILVSHRPSALLPTIRSRCVPVPVQIPDAKVAAAWLEAQGVREAARWLAFAGGAPLRALEYASGERGEAIEDALKLVASGDPAAFASVTDREELDPLAELLQKVALDRAFAALCGKAKYSPSLKGAGPGDALAWLTYARELGRHRLLARHPLNPRLLAADMLAGMPSR